MRGCWEHIAAYKAVGHHVCVQRLGVAARELVQLANALTSSRKECPCATGEISNAQSSYVLRTRP